MNSLIDDIAGYSVYYTLFFLLLLFLLARILNWVEDKWILVSAGFILIFIAAFRAPGIDNDYLNYIDYFGAIGKPANYFAHYSDWFMYEPVYYLLPSILKLFLLKQVYLLFIFLFYATLSITLQFTLIKKISASPSISILYFFSYYFLLHEMTQIRVAVACGCMLWAAYFHYHKKYRQFVLVWLTACLFHYVALIIPLLLFIHTKKFSSKKCYILLALSFLFTAIKLQNIIPFFSSIDAPFIQKMNLGIQGLAGVSKEINVWGISHLLNMLMAFWLVHNHKAIYRQNEYAHLFIKLQVLSLFFFGFFSFVPYLALRVSEFFGIANIITASFVVYSFRSRIAGYAAITLYSLITLIATLHVFELLQPYSFVFAKK